LREEHFIVKEKGEKSEPSEMAIEADDLFD
jgi:hypothetical protein